MQMPDPRQGQEMKIQGRLQDQRILLHLHQPDLQILLLGIDHQLDQHNLGQEKIMSILIGMVMCTDEIILATGSREATDSGTTIVRGLVMLLQI